MGQSGVQFFKADSENGDINQVEGKDVGIAATREFQRKLIVPGNLLFNYKYKL